jgi:hypothetical protein
VVCEVVGFGSFIVVVGAMIVLISSDRYNKHADVVVTIPKIFGAFQHITHI